MLKYTPVLFCILLLSCNTKSTSNQEILSLQGTWKLQRGTIVENGDTAVTDYTTGRSFIKVINATHFAFLNHDLHKGRDTLSSFGAGGGTYSLNDSIYTEHLEYCSDRAWEGHDFTFTISLVGDRLIQRGIEKIESQGIERMNTEEYIRLH